jgi:purine-binding chemotaxis protein CheW
MKTALKQTQLLDQQLALGAYLDALLVETPAPPATGVDVPGSPETRATAPEEPQAMPVPAVAADDTGVQQPAATDIAGVPVWAGERFQALLFEVAGLTLAVPLVKLKGVITQSGALTPMPGQAPLFAGLAGYQGQQSRVVDTARLVLPADRAAQLDPDISGRCHSLVMIDDGRWALACSRIGDVIELDSGGVKWRSAGGRRLWLAGTVIERMCALLDIDQLILELAAAAD